MTVRPVARYVGKLVVDGDGRRSTILLRGTAATIRAAEPVAGAPVVPGGLILLENGSYILLENGSDRLTLEA